MNKWFYLFFLFSVELAAQQRILTGKVSAGEAAFPALRSGSRVPTPVP